MKRSPTTRFDAAKLVHQLVDGSAPNEFSIADVVIPPTFVRMVVIDVIYDPLEVDEKLLEHWQHTIKVKNSQFISSAPRNSIIAGYVLDGTAVASSPPMLLYPFFPSHLSLPVKPGEHVWVMFEHPDAMNIEIGYWMCRIVDPHVADDVNHAHSARQYEPSYFPSNTAKTKGKIDPKFEFRNGITFDDGTARYVRGNTAFISGTEDQYEKLVMGKEGWGLSSKLIQHESVPRYKKRPGDLVFEGSNNSLVVLGTDRSSTAATFKDTEYGRQGEFPTTDVKEKSGMIDLVVGRGQTPKTGGTEGQAKTISGADMWKELNKAKPVAEEGDPDLKADRSRISIYQKSKIDTNFGLDRYNKENYKDAPGTSGSGLVDGSGDGGIVIKSDKVRVIARSDVEIVVTGFKRDLSGNMESKDATDEWASIVIRSNGDIIFKPAEKGVIKLGGDDANKAVMCVVSPNASNTLGTVYGKPITNSMGGTTGFGGESGEWATKVLVK